MSKPLLALVLIGISAMALDAQDAARGRTLYAQQCGSCHGEKLEGRSAPPLVGGDFGARWPTAGLLEKIKNTMPQDNPGKLTQVQAADLTAYIQETGKAAGGPATVRTAAAGLEPAFPATGNLTQLMRGVMFPNSNILFTVQTHDPAVKKKAGEAANSDGGFNWAAWGNDLYSGWDIVDYAAIALAESAPLMLTPGRTCENGKPVPVNDPDWIKFTKEMAEVGRAAYRASQTRNQEKVSDITGDVADSCSHCHQVFRDVRRRGAGSNDPSAGKELRCTKAVPAPAR